ncbi:MAG: ABC transporter permease [Mycoplasmatales bacterium]|nr:ABC transporter permease [Mycoplasmatales bacterium]
MWKTFIAELKYILKNKWRITGFIMMLFIPFVYGFLYLNAYWAPFKHVDKLHIAVVSEDPIEENGKKTISGRIVDELVKNGITTGTTNIYKYSVESNQSVKNDPKKVVDSGQYSAVIVIPKGYSKSLELGSTFLAAALAPPILPINSHVANIEAWEILNSSTLLKAEHQNFKKIVNKAKEDLKKPNSILFDTINIHDIFEAMAKDVETQNKTSTFEKLDRITFYNSYKNSYLSGEMTNYISDSLSLILKSITPLFHSDTESVQNIFSQIKNMLNGQVKNVLSNTITKTAPNINTYGMGLAPYFISIALWAGALVMTFIIKNERHLKDQSTIRHYFGKTILWILSGWVQSIILISAMWIQGVDLGWSKQWELYLFALFMSTIFTLTIQAISFSIRYADISELLVVILLVLQLISSSGTFPVEMQNVIFKIIHPVVPFTYTIHSIREIFWDTDWILIIKDIFILLIFPIIFIPISLFSNYRFDKKTLVKQKGIKKYQSFEIDLGDF